MASRADNFASNLSLANFSKATELRRTVEADEVGRTALVLASDYTTAITGEVLYVDAGVHRVAQPGGSVGWWQEGDQDVVQVQGQEEGQQQEGAQGQVVRHSVVVNHTV